MLKKRRLPPLVPSLGEGVAEGTATAATEGQVGCKSHGLIWGGAVRPL